MRRQSPFTTLSSAPRRPSWLQPRALALLDVLIGMAIFALIAVIAVIAVGQYRERAFVTGAISDARSVGLAIESAATQSGEFPTKLEADGTGDRAIVATVASTTVSTAPATVEKKIGVITPGNRIGAYEYLKATKADGAGFQVCVEHVENGAVGTAAVADAHAVYDSIAGGVIVSGHGNCETAMESLPGGSDDSDDDGTGEPGDGTGDEDGTGDGDEESALDAPVNVTVDNVPGQARATITWDAVPGAATYALYLDDATTPAWTGTELTTELTGLSGGDHEVTVTARAAGDESAKSEPTKFTIYCNNDAFACAHPVDITGANDTWTSRNYTNTNATTEAGENDDLSARGMWWTYTAPAYGTTRISIVADSDGAGPYPYGSIYAWKSTASTVTAAQTGQKWGTYRTHAIDVPTIKGETYKIRVGATYGDVGKYRIKVETGPAHDYVEEAIEIPSLATTGSWTSPNQNNDLAGYQAGETDNLGAPRSLWWSYTAETSGTTKLTMLPTTDGVGPVQYGGIWAWETTASDIATVQAAPVKANAYRSSGTTFDAVKGRTYKIRIGTTYNDVGKFRLRIDAPPANDNVENALPIGSLPANDSWTSADQNNALAGMQAGENSDLGSQRGMWWTYTATTSGTTRITMLPTTDGVGPVQYGGIWAWETTASDIATVQAAPVKANAYRSSQTTFNATKGQTYKIRIGTTYGDIGSFRVRVETGPGNDNVVDAINVPPMTGGGTYTSPDTSNELAGKESGENDDLSTKGLWWTYTPTTTGNVRVNVIAASDGGTLPRPSIYVWDSAALAAAQVQTGTRYGDWSTTAITFPGTAGKTYKIRIGNVYGDVGKYRVKIDAL